MLALVFILMVTLMYRLNLFQEVLGYREHVILERHVMQALDDAQWEDEMTAFREAHPRLTSRSYMTLGASGKH